MPCHMCHEFTNLLMLKDSVTLQFRRGLVFVEELFGALWRLGLRSKSDVIFCKMKQISCSGSDDVLQARPACCGISWQRGLNHEWKFGQAQERMHPAVATTKIMHVGDAF